MSCRSLSVKEYSRQELEEMIEKRAASGADGRLVSKDLAVGKEKVCDHGLKPPPLQFVGAFIAVCNCFAASCFM